MILLREADKPKSPSEKIAEYLSRPPQPILRFYGDFRSETSNGKRYVLFTVRNGLPIPLFYGIYVQAEYDSFVDYAEKADHIGPFSTDNWKVTLDTTAPAQIEIRIGIVPLEILCDKVQLAI